MKISDKVKMAYSNMKEGKATGSKISNGGESYKDPEPNLKKWLKLQGFDHDKVQKDGYLMNRRGVKIPYHLLPKMHAQDNDTYNYLEYKDGAGREYGAEPEFQLQGVSKIMSNNEGDMVDKVQKVIDNTKFTGSKTPTLKDGGSVGNWYPRNTNTDNDKDAAAGSEEQNIGYSERQGGNEKVPYKEPSLSYGNANSQVNTMLDKKTITKLNKQNAKTMGTKITQKILKRRQKQR